MALLVHVESMKQLFAFAEFSALYEVKLLHHKMNNNGVVSKLKISKIQGNQYIRAGYAVVGGAVSQDNYFVVIIFFLPVLLMHARR